MNSSTSGDRNLKLQHSEASLFGVGDVKIFYQLWAPENPRAVVVIAHGLGEHSGRYAQVAEQLCAGGCAVYALDHRGHGHSGGAPAYVDRFANAVADMDQLVDIARREQRTLALFLLGHSMGGALSLSYALKFQGKLDGLILSGPAVALDGAPPLLGPLAKFLSAVTPKLGLFSVKPELVSRDQAAVADYGADPLNCHGKVPARTLGEIIRLVEWLPDALSTLSLPLLVMHGSEDKLAGPSGSRMIVERVSSTDKTLKIYPGLFHEIFNELPQDRAQVLVDLCGWVAVHIASFSAPAKRA